MSMYVKAEASAWYQEMFDPEPNAAAPTPERQAQFEAWLLNPGNRDVLYSVMSISTGLKTLIAMPARQARELIGEDYEPILECFDGGNADDVPP